MFLRKIPNQSVKRRAIRHWPLLLLRIAAFALLALAFRAPFWPGAGAAAAAEGGREVLILLDTSHSMAYGGVWARAQEAARAAGQRTGPRRPGDGGVLGTDVEVGVRPRPTGGARGGGSTAPPPGAGAPGTALHFARLRGCSNVRPAAPQISSSRLPESGWDQARTRSCLPE